MCDEHCVSQIGLLKGKSRHEVEEIDIELCLARSVLVAATVLICWVLVQITGSV